MENRDSRVEEDVAELPEEMVIQVNGESLVIDLGKVTIGDWLAILAENDNEKKMVEMIKFNQKVIGEKYADLPLVFMRYVNGRILQAVVRLFIEEDGKDAPNF